MTKILVVDDNQQNRYMLQVLLSTNGYEVVLAANGADALEQAHHARPGLIISDILMPVMDGFALCRAWKADEGLKQIPFVFYTATYTDPQDEKFALSLGAERFIVKPEEPARFLSLLRDVLDTHKAGNLQAVGRTVDDLAYYKEYNDTLIRKLEDKVVQLEDANRALEADIIKRIRAEDEIRQLNFELEQRVEARTRELQDTQEKLVQQERLATLGRLAGGVSHELRNPLGVITNAVYFLKFILPNADEKVREYLEILERESQVASQLVSDLLNFSNIQTGDRQPVSVLDLVNQTLERHPTPASVDVMMDFPPDLPQAFVDPHQIVQALGNLVVNAYQAMPAGGTLLLHGDAFAVDGRSGLPDSGLRITVRDTGMGIPPEYMPKLFEPLFSTKPRGIGLGLVLSQKLVEANGGRIEVKSQPGQGAAFTLFLPAKL